jgi:hypothetical protein
MPTPSTNDTTFLLYSQSLTDCCNGVSGIYHMGGMHFIGISHHRACITFDLDREPVVVPRSVGVKQGYPLSPTLFMFVMQAFLEPDAKPKFRTNTRIERRNGGPISGTD